MSKPFTSVRKTSAPRRPPGRTLRLETLECRSLLAGDAYLINFQFDEVGTPARYQRDSGAVFGDRGNGLSYGWSVNHADVARARGVDPDLRLDTLIHFHAGATWELALANGLYEVTVAVGDPGNNDGVHTLNVEGVNFFDAVPDGDGAIVKTLPVMVADGRLTLDSGAALEKATRIDDIHVVGLPAGPNAAPLAPTITEPAADGQVVNPADVHMEAVGFSDPDGNLHKSSDWEIRTPAGVIVWQTLGIEGVERLHTHLGDGVFINSHAGRHELLPNADFELHVRFRDDAGAVSDYAVRAFHTGASSTTFPMQVLDVADSPPLSWQDSAGVDVELPSAFAIFSPGDPIIAIDAGGGSAYPLNETPQNAIDGTLNKYLNFGAIGSGFIVTPSRGPSVVTSFQITTANDFDVRDPASWLLFGTNSPIASVDNSAGNGEPWTLIDSGTLSLPSNRNALAPMVAVDNAAQYASYRMIFSGVKNPEAANSMQFAEIQFFGESSSASLPTLGLQSGATGEPLVQVSGAVAAGNHLTSFPGLADHAQVRVVIESGAAALA
ncbi:MAG: hypothetical protein IT424_13410, partial [Pirellulales bacterium]|nr:hypothetical protein [Pirellulales bacterium]